MNSINKGIVSTNINFIAQTEMSKTIPIKSRSAYTYLTLYRKFRIFHSNIRSSNKSRNKLFLNSFASSSSWLTKKWNKVNGANTLQKNKKKSPKVKEGFHPINVVEIRNDRSKNKVVEPLVTRVNHGQWLNSENKNAIDQNYTQEDVIQNSLPKDGRKNSIRLYNFIIF